jgi:hypothetical protein
MFNQYDGNPEGTSFLPPQIYSYASNIEMALNTDVRDLTSNLIPINALSGQLKDADGFTMTAKFRYSPTKGFVMSFEPSINPDIPVYLFRLLPCSYIANAHYVHGFGIVNKDSPAEFTPRDLWTVAYFSDDTPTLLPFRYITITSPELNKDRRLISFQNSNSTKFVNELAIFPVSPQSTGTYHTNVAGEDSTVISKRDDYNPQSFRITISDEFGNTLQCDDPIGNLLSDNDVYPIARNSFLFGSQVNRGNSYFTNLITFGLGPSNYSIPSFVEFSLNSSNVPSGMTTFQRSGYNYDLTSQFPAPPAGTAEQNVSFPFIVTDKVVPTILGNYIGLGNTITLKSSWPHLNNFIPPCTILSQAENQSRWTYDTTQNPNPGLSFDLKIEQIGLGAFWPSKVYLWVGIYSYTIGQWICGRSFSKSTVFVPISSSSPGSYTFSVSDTPITLQTNASVQFQIIQPQTVGIFLIAYATSGSAINNNVGFKVTVPPGGKMRWFNLSPRPEGPGTYVPPVVAQYGGSTGYPFGNPQANGLCEELIHEIITVIKDN